MCAGADVLESLTVSSSLPPPAHPHTAPCYYSSCPSPPLIPAPFALAAEHVRVRRRRWSVRRGAVTCNGAGGKLRHWGRSGGGGGGGLVRLAGARPVPSAGRTDLPVSCWAGGRPRPGLAGGRLIGALMPGHAVQACQRDAVCVDSLVVVCRRQQISANLKHAQTFAFISRQACSVYPTASMCCLST